MLKYTFKIVESDFFFKLHINKKSFDKVHIQVKAILRLKKFKK